VTNRSGDPPNPRPSATGNPTSSRRSTKRPAGRGSGTTSTVSSSPSRTAGSTGRLAASAPGAHFVRDALRSETAEDAARYVERAVREDAYDGFNLVVADESAALYFEWDGQLAVSEPPARRPRRRQRRRRRPVPNPRDSPGGRRGPGGERGPPARPPATEARRGRRVVARPRTDGRLGPRVRRLRSWGRVRNSLVLAPDAR